MKVQILVFSVLFCACVSSESSKRHQADELHLEGYREELHTPPDFLLAPGQRYARAILGEKRVWLIIDDSTDRLFVDLDGDSDLRNPKEIFSGQVRPTETPLFPGKETIIVEIPHIDENLSMGLEWVPGDPASNILISTSHGEIPRQIAFPVFGNSHSSATVLPFESHPQVALYGKPFEAHRASDDDDPKVVFRVGTFGLGPNSFVSYRHESLPKEMDPTGWVRFDSGERQQIIFDDVC